MKKLAIALGAVALAAAATGVSAQEYRYYYNDSEQASREQARAQWEAQRAADAQEWRQDHWRERRADNGVYECWNPGANHYEAVRPGERQDDLDFSQCRGGQPDRTPYGYRY